MTEAPKRIWTEPSLPGYVDEKSDLWTVEYIRADLVPAWSTDMDAAPRDGTVIWVIHEHEINRHAAFDSKVKKAQWLQGLEEWRVEGVGGNVAPILTHWRHIDLPNDPT